MENEEERYQYKGTYEIRVNGEKVGTVTDVDINLAEDEDEDTEEIIVAEGMWISGREQSGHYVAGYVEKLDISDETALVRVVHACCKHVVGRQRWVHLDHDMDVLDETKYDDTEGYLLNAIDVALDARDEVWFEQLVKQLNELRNPEPRKRKSVLIIRHV